MLPADKTSLRQQLLTARRDISESRRPLANRQIADFTVDAITVWQREYRAGAVFAYLSRADEVSTEVIIDRCLEMKIEVAVPRITSKTAMYATEFPGWGALEPGPLGILRPPQTVSLDERVSIALIPGVGFSAAGDRLGFGAGYYDRWLAAHPNALRVGLGYDVQVIDALPRESHDVALDYLVTESGIRDCDARKIDSHP